MLSKAMQTWVGIFMLCGIIALVLLAVRVSSGALTGEKSYTITATFDNVGGLAVKAPVRIGGVKIGQVTDISIENGEFTPTVTLSINSKYNELPYDTTAAILTSGVLGANYLGIEPGADDTLFLGEGDQIHDTQSAIQLESLISQFIYNSSTGSK